MVCNCSTLSKIRHLWRHYDTQHNDIQHNDTQQNDIQHKTLISDIRRNDTQPSDTQHNTDIMLNVVVLSVAIYLLIR